VIGMVALLFWGPTRVIEIEQPQQSAGSFDSAVVWETAASSSSVPVAVTKVLTANPGRLGFAMENTGSFQIFCTLNATSTTANLDGAGIALNTSSTTSRPYDSRERRIEYTGDVYCSAPNGTSSVSIAEYLPN